jgi:hypothetical protein
MDRESRRIEMQIHAARISACLVVVGLFTMCVPTSQAALYEFYNITNNEAGNAAIGEAQLTVEVTGFGVNQARFEFRNAGPEASSITGVYFDDGGEPILSNLASIVGGPGVSFSEGGSVLPGGYSLSPKFVVTAGLQARSDPPTQPNGVNPGEWLQLTLDLQAGTDLDDVLDRLNTADLRLGIHVQGFEDGGSESFINKRPPVAPLPGAVILAGLGLAVSGGALRRRKDLTAS